MGSGRGALGGLVAACLMCAAALSWNLDHPLPSSCLPLPPRPSPSPPPTHQVEQREKEARQKAKAEAHLYCSVRLARDRDMAEQVGRDVWFDLVDYDKLPEASSLRVRKHTKFGELKQLVAEHLGVPVEKQRYWTWTKRQNNTIRLADVQLGPEHEDQSLMDLREHAEIVSGLWGVGVGGGLMPTCAAT